MVAKKPPDAVDTAVDGLEGLDKAKRHPPDFMLLDVMLPGCNGYEVSRLLKEWIDHDPHARAFPVILLTAKGEALLGDAGKGWTAAPEGHGKRVAAMEREVTEQIARNPVPKEWSAVLEAGFESPDAIGPYMRSLIFMHRDTMGVAIK